MRKKNTKNPLLDTISETLDRGGQEFGENVTDVTTILDNIDPDEDSVDDLEDKDDEPVETEGTKDEDEDIPQEILDKMKQASSNDDQGLGDGETSDGNDEETSPQEAEQIGAFFDAFAEALNWDVTDEEKPNSIESLIDYIGDMVEQNSVPQYANEQIAQLDAYVKNGGRFEDFYNGMSQRLSYDGLDMEDESNQKTVVRDYMKYQGYTDEQINRRIERYEDADMLMDEAEDAVDRLKFIQEQRLQAAAQQQADLRAQQEEEARQFMTDLNTSINTLTDIRGIAIPKEDRKRLLDYITKTDADGLSQYQKDFKDNMINNLIESAYFTMKGDALLGEARRNGQTSAANKLRTMLKHQAKNHSTYDAQDEKQVSALDIASKLYR